jgi:hypothetical protein
LFILPIVHVLIGQGIVHRYLLHEKGDGVFLWQGRCGFLPADQIIDPHRFRCRSRLLNRERGWCNSKSRQCGGVIRGEGRRGLYALEQEVQKVLDLPPLFG